MMNFSPAFRVFGHIPKWHPDKIPPEYGSSGLHLLAVVPDVSVRRIVRIPLGIFIGNSASDTEWVDPRFKLGAQIRIRLEDGEGNPIEVEDYRKHVLLPPFLSRDEYSILDPGTCIGTWDLSPSALIVPVTGQVKVKVTYVRCRLSCAEELGVTLNEVAPIEFLLNVLE